MKKAILFCVLFLFFSLLSLADANAQVNVKGYYRKDGTYVRPHTRSSPGSRSSSSAYISERIDYEAEKKHREFETEIKEARERFIAECSKEREWKRGETLFCTGQIDGFDNGIILIKVKDDDGRNSVKRIGFLFLDDTSKEIAVIYAAVKNEDIKKVSIKRKNSDKKNSTSIVPITLTRSESGDFSLSGESSNLSFMSIGDKNFAKAYLEVFEKMNKKKSHLVWGMITKAQKDRQ